MKKAAIIILNYNGYNDTANCINMMKKIGACDDELYIVDNHSDDDSYQLLTKNFPKINIIHSVVNGGYAFGNNLGIKAAIQAGFSKFFVVNPDIRFDYDFISPIVELMDSNPDIGIASPCVRYSSGKIQSAGGKMNLFWGRAIFNYMGSDYRDLGVIDADYVSGGCLAITKEALEMSGMIPEEYFLNYEDNEWCLRVKKNNFRVVCDTSIFVFHDGEASIDKISGLGKYFMCRNRVLFERRNASIIQKIFFYPFAVINALRYLVFHGDWSVFQAYFDGLSGRNKYLYLQK